MKHQLTFHALKNEKLKTFGGSLLKGNPRSPRPLSLKRPLHLVLRSSIARGDLSLLRRAREIEDLVHRTARASDVKVYRFANSGNHLHLIVRPRTRRAFHAFIRAITGLIARLVLCAERGRAHGTRFWDARPFTRIIEWGREFRQVGDYLLQNILEARGLIHYRARATKPPDKMSGARTAGRRFRQNV